MKQKFSVVKKNKENELNKLIQMKSNWKEMSSKELFKLHKKIVSVESEIEQLQIFKKIKNKFKL